MKKILLIMPLMAIFLFGCANKTDDSIVNEQEMYDAFALKDVEYLQSSGVRHSDGTILTIVELSPTCFHTIDEESEWGFYHEYYYLKANDNLRGWERHSKENDFEEITDPDERDFPTMEDIRQEIFEMLDGKKYKDFEYQEDTKEYLTNFHYEENEDYITAIRFSNKKVKEFTTWAKSSDRENFYNKISFEYKHFTPTPPIK